MLSLVLVLVERAMHDSLTGGLSALHIPREGWIEMNELFQDPTVGRTDDDPSEITTIENFENEMTGLSEASQHSCKYCHKGLQNPRRARMRTCIVQNIS